MYLNTKASFTKNNFINLLLALFPFSFIAGNMIININLILIIISALIFFKIDLFKIKFFLIDKLLFLFFFLIILTGVINDYHFFNEELAWKGYFSTVYKSVLFLKYLVFYMILRFLVEKDIVNFKFFFIFCGMSVLFVSLDILYQFFNGHDIFGFTGTTRKLSGPFGDELIAGGFIQRFSLFVFFLLPFFFRKIFPYKTQIFLIPLIFIIIFLGLILSGNRMPTLIFLFIILLIIIFQKQVRRFFIPFIIIFPLIFFLIYQSSENVKNNFLSFYGQIYKISEFNFTRAANNNKSPQYLREFSSFYETWLINKYVGGGIKNFRYYCHKRNNIPKNTNFVCNMHPHNYYLEILTETGAIGLIIISILFVNIIYLSLIKKYFLKSTLNNNNIIIPFIFLFIAEIFPFKSTGSFFTTGNSTYLFLIIGIMIGLIRKNNRIENKN